MPLITTWTPRVAFVKNPWEWGSFRADIQRFGRMVRGELAPGPEALITAPTLHDVRMMGMRGTVAVDIETDGINPLTCNLRTVGLGCPEWGLSHEWGTDTEIEAAIFTLLADERVVKVLHNGPWFDLRVLERYGAQTNNWVDTRDRRRALSSTSKLSLAYITSVYDDAPPWKEGDDENEKLALTKDWEKLKRYNAEDCVRTARCEKAMRGEMDARTRRLYDIHAKLSIICADMHTTGIPFDTARRDELADQLRARYEEKAAKFVELCGIEGMRCTATDLRKLLFARHETSAIKRFSLPDPQASNRWVKKKHETIAVDQNSLLLLLCDPMCPKEVAPIIDAYWQAEGAWKARSVYVISEKVSQAIGADGRLRAGWNSAGTNTGRFSCNSPNILNLAKKQDEEGGALVGDLPDMRSMYYAPPGQIFIEADYAQQELRVMWAVSGDEVLGDALQTGDVYTQDAIAIFRLPPDTTKKTCKPAARQTAKIGHLGFQYGASVPTLFKQFLESDRRIQYHIVELVHAQLRERYSVTVEYWFAEMARVLECGYSESRILQRRRVYPQEPGLSDVANYPIQATASDITNLATIAVWDALRKYVPSAKIVVQQFDSMLILSPVRHQEEVCRLLRDIMEAPVLIGGRQLSIPIEIKLKERWSG